MEPVNSVAVEPVKDVQAEKKVQPLNHGPIKPLVDTTDPPPKEPLYDTSDSVDVKEVTREEAKLAIQNEHSQPTIEASQPITERVQSSPATEPAPPPPNPVQQVAIDKKKKEEEKLAIYKALAIKLKKELVKVKDELQKLQADKDSECRSLSERVEVLEKNLATQSESTASTISTLEATIKNLKQQLTSSEQDFSSLQENFENYKNKAQLIMQQNSLTQPQCNKSIEDERLRQLKELNEDQLKQIATLEKQLSFTGEKNRGQELELRQLQEKLIVYQEKFDFLECQQQRYETIQHENESLKIVLKQFRTKLREPNPGESTRNFDDELIYTDRLLANTLDHQENNKDYGNGLVQINQDLQEAKINELTEESNKDSCTDASSSSQIDLTGINAPKLSSIPTTFEITSDSSAIDARNQIDSLTKAYLDSENTNALLSDQVATLKQEIRRLQLAAERIELADNLEYLKNILLKFLSLDGNQTAQKQRLVPVLSTVLKLTPDETMLLSSTAMASDRNSLASSFFKL